jgi:hypothetical protein
VTELQHMTALASANRIRLAAADLKREVAEGDLDIVDALGDERAQPMWLGDLLLAQPRWGSVRADKLCGELKVNALRRVRELTDRQRQALVDHFDPPPPRPAPPKPPLTSVAPEQVDARVVAAVLRGSVTRTELELRIREMCLAVDDLDAALVRLLARNAIATQEANGFLLYTVESQEIA